MKIVSNKFFVKPVILIFLICTQNVVNANSMLDILQSNPPGETIPFCSGATIFMGGFFSKNETQKNNIIALGVRMAKFGKRFNPDSEKNAGGVAGTFSRKYVDSTTEQQRKQVETHAATVASACISYMKQQGFSFD